MSRQPSPVPSDDAGRILLVDEETTSLDTLRRTLDGRGYRLFIARSGEEAITVARQARPMVVLLDVVLPGIDGYETCRRLKKDPETRDAAVIFLSSLDEAKDKVKGFEAGAVDFITRPFQGAEVVARVDSHLGIQRSLRRQLEAAPITPIRTPAEATPPAADQRTEAGLESLPLVSGFGVAAPVFRTGEVVADRFRIARFLARGGMGELYEAEDLELHERVALKTILSTIADDERSILLFKREVHLARQVTHPNVCRIFDVFRHRPSGVEGGGPGNDVVFLAMELLHGETLADRLRREGRMSTTELLPLVRQMAVALSAAHRAGVIHRDFKSHNVMLVPPTPPDVEPRAVITDFGLARRDAPDDASSPFPALTGAGISGTPAYMAPEQVEGGAVTPATDVYALGVVLYETVTGSWPFKGETALQIAVKRLKEAPPSPRLVVPDLDARWDATILRCLALRPEDRFAGAGEVVAALEGRAEPRVAAPTARRWLVAGLAGIAIVALGAVSWLYRSHAARTLGTTDTVVLADFSNTTGDTVFDDTLKQALATGLQQSPFFNLLGDRTVRDTLKLMGRSADEGLNGEVAQELCQRTGSAGVIAGSISSLGTQYVIGLNALDCRSGDALGRETATAARKEDVLAALDQATTRLRRRVGESLASVRKYDTPIAQATTPSLEALKAFSLGIKARNERGDAAAIPLFKQAISLDPDFAMAYGGLGNVYSSLREYDLATENFKKAYDRRDRVSERERFALTASYYSKVTVEVEKANQAYELWAQAYPREWVPRNNLGVNYEFLGQYEKALSETLESIRLNPESGVSYANVVAYYVRLGRLHEAKAAYQKALTRNLDRPGLHFNRYAVAFLEGDAAEMERQMAWGAGRTGAAEFLLSYQSDTEGFSGRLGKARDSSRRAAETARGADEKETAALTQIHSALREAELGNAGQARAEVASGLALASTSNVRILAALALARTGDADRALEMADALERESPLNTKTSGYWLPAIRAAAELDRKDPAKAVEHLKAAARYELGVPDPQPGLGGPLYPAYLRGQAFLLLRQGEAAASEFQKLADHKGVVVNHVLGALARLGLARALAAQGDAGRARDAYQDFLELWKDADSDIPVLQQARAERSRLG
jgi:CheY-like chemotaxis protein/tetratricopeptide (TPR) repeat protein